MGGALLGRWGDDGSLQGPKNAAGFNAAVDDTFALHAAQAVFTVRQGQCLAAKRAISFPVLFAVRARTFD